MVAWGADFSAEIERGEGLAKSGKMAEVKKIIEEMTTQPDGKPYAALLIARIQFAAGKGDLALSSLLKEFPTENAVKQMPTTAQIAYGNTLRVLRRFDEAAAIADRIGSELSGMSRVQAGELMSDVFVDRQRWQDALEWISVAIKILDSFKYSDEEKAYLAALHAKRSKIEQVIELLTHGLGFKLYRTGNAQRFEKHYADAIATYDKLLELHIKNKGKPIPEITGIEDPKVNDFPIHDIYAAAAQAYRGECLLKQGKYSDAINALGPVGNDLMHPYRGESLRLIGDAILESTGDIKSAEKQYSAAICVLIDTERQSRTLDKYQVPSVSQKITKPPKEMREYKGWGNLEWYRLQPEQIINADTCDWYVEFQLMQAQIKRSMCYFMNGETQNAVSDLDIITRVDESDRLLTQKNMPSNFLRLRDDYRSGRLYATSCELSAFSGIAKTRLVAAEVLFEMEQWDDALDGYNKIASDPKLRLSHDALAYLNYARACIAIYAGRKTEMTKYIAGFMGEKAIYKDTYTYWRALFLLANQFPDKQEAYLLQGANGCLDSTLKPSFGLRLGQWYFLGGDYTKAAIMFHSVQQSTDKSDYRNIASAKYLSQIPLKRQMQVAAP